MALEAGDEGIAVSVVTVLELAHGITRADTAERRLRRRRFLDELVTGVPVHAVTVPPSSPWQKLLLRNRGSITRCIY